MSVKMDPCIILIKACRQRMITIIDGETISMKNFIIYFSRNEIFDTVFSN